jgi:hypothetical protein
MMKKLLEKKDIDLVKPKFRQMVLDAWNRGEGVPYGVIYLSEALLKASEKDVDNLIIKQIIDMLDANISTSSYSTKENSGFLGECKCHTMEPEKCPLHGYFMK